MTKIGITTQYSGYNTVFFSHMDRIQQSSFVAKFLFFSPKSKISLALSKVFDQVKVIMCL